MKGFWPMSILAASVLVAPPAPKPGDLLRVNGDGTVEKIKIPPCTKGIIGVCIQGRGKSGKAKKHGPHN